MIVDKINAWLTAENKNLEEGAKYLLKQEYSQLTGFSFDRQFLAEKKESNGDLRFSSAGKCPRALAYDLNHFEANGKEIDSRGKRTFFIGDMTETMIVLLAKASGVPIFGYGLQQPKIKWSIAGTDIFGHPDGFVLDQEECRILTVEIKSMNTRAFERFEKEGVDEGHLFQINANMKAAGTSACVYVAFNKDTSVLGERIVRRDESIINKIEANFTEVLFSTPENLPVRPYAPDAKRFLPWNCLYCSFHGHCWPTAKKVLVGKAYKLMVPEEVGCAK